MCFEFLVEFLTFENVEDVVTMVTLSVGAYVGYQGLETWKKQLKGNQEYTLAKNLLLYTYKYKEALFNFRRFSLSEVPTPTFTPEEQATPKLSARYYYQNLIKIDQNKWEKVSECIPNLKEAILESDVMWGSSELKNLYAKLFEYHYESYSDIFGFAESMNPDKENKAMKPFNAKKVFGEGTEKNEFKTKFDALIVEIEDFLKPKIHL